MPVSQVISFLVALLSLLTPLLVIAAVMSPVLISGYFARRSAVKAGYYDQGR